MTDISIKMQVIKAKDYLRFNKGSIVTITALRMIKFTV